MKKNFYNHMYKKHPTVNREGWCCMPDVWSLAFVLYLCVSRARLRLLAFAVDENALPSDCDSMRFANSAFPFRLQPAVLLKCVSSLWFLVAFIFRLLHSQMKSKCILAKSWWTWYGVEVNSRRAKWNVQQSRAPNPKFQNLTQTKSQRPQSINFH